MKYLCIKQPWLYLILFGLKDVENRRKPTKYRGRFVVVASKTIDKHWQVRLDSAGLLSETQKYFIAYTVKTKPLLGHALGTVELIDCVRDSKSHWAEPGAWHWVLRDPQPFDKPVPFVAGRLGLFDGPEPDETGLFRPHDGTTRRVDVRVEPADVMITRPGKWGNPFKIKRADPSDSWAWTASSPRNWHWPQSTICDSRDEAIQWCLEKYEQWIRKRIKSERPLKAALPELRGKRLGCYCRAGEPCHGDILVRLVKGLDR